MAQDIEIIKLRRSVDNLIDELEKAQAEIKQLTAADGRDTLIDLVAEDIEWQEQYNPNSKKLAPIVAAYRQIRPKPKQTKKKEAI